MQNAFVESFNSRLRDECLSEHVFTTLTEARTLSGLTHRLQHNKAERSVDQGAAGGVRRYA